jgi:hypothetical protein
MAVIDRNLLRLALYELRHCPEQPYKVVINDAIELAKKYSTAESGRFVNGILGAIVRQMYPDAAGERARLPPSLRFPPLRRVLVPPAWGELRLVLKPYATCSVRPSSNSNIARLNAAPCSPDSTSFQ